MWGKSWLLTLPPSARSSLSRSASADTARPPSGIFPIPVTNTTPEMSKARFPLGIQAGTGVCSFATQSYSRWGPFHQRAFFHPNIPAAWDRHIIFPIRIGSWVLYHAIPHFQAHPNHMKLVVYFMISPWLWKPPHDINNCDSSQTITQKKPLVDGRIHVNSHPIPSFVLSLLLMVTTVEPLNPLWFQGAVRSFLSCSVSSSLGSPSDHSSESSNLGKSAGKHGFYPRR